MLLEDELVLDATLRSKSNRLKEESSSSKGLAAVDLMLEALATQTHKKYTTEPTAWENSCHRTSAQVPRTVIHQPAKQTSSREMHG